jgi:hypothetical protein
MPVGARYDEVMEMKAHTMRIARRLGALILALALAVPATALAAPQQRAGQGDEASYGRGEFVAQSGLGEQVRERVKSRVRERVRTRVQRFGTAVEVLQARIDRLETIAGRVDEAGGDVGEVLDLLDEARRLIQVAEGLEAEAVGLLESIADSDDPRATWEAAKAKAKEASETLRSARRTTTDAAKALRQIIVGLVEVE